MLKNQVAIVTGSSSGIGRAIAIEFAKRGAKVVINYHSSEKNANEVLNIVNELSDGIVVQADVSKEEDVKNLIETTVSTFGRLDIMVANAGLQVDAPFLEMTLAQWQKVIDVNLTGQFLAMNYASKQFMRQERDGEKARGKIVCMSSVHDVIPWAGHANYASSKGGVLMLMKTIAQELAPEGIRVNAISPGAIQTRINEEAWQSPENLKSLMKLIPYKRIGKPEDIGKAAAWLACDESDYVNGETLYVDGGMTLYPEFTDNG